MMTLKNLAITAIAASCLSFSAVAADAPGVGDKKAGNSGTISDLGRLDLVDNYGGAYNLTARVTSRLPFKGEISGTASACERSSYEVAGTFLGSTVHLDVLLISGRDCLNYVVDCVINSHTKTCFGNFTNEDGGTGAIILSK